MALTPGGSSLPGDSHAYRFWAEFTAAQARNTGKPSLVIDRRVRRFFKDMCREASPSVVLEVGAHEGGFSEWAKSTFPGARCLALEANPYVHRKHRKRLSRAGVEYLQLAAAATSGTVTIHIPTQVAGRSREPQDSRMASLVVHAQASHHATVEVEAVRIDDLVELDADDRVVAWIDVEGASDAVLAGAREVLARADAVYIEVESEEVWPGQWLDVDVARFFRSIGKIPALRDIQRRRQYNVVFLGDDLALRQNVIERAARVLRPPRGQPRADRATG
jgi:FkbM family methyltransferase